jgi:hypothetical protein
MNSIRSFLESITSQSIRNLVENQVEFIKDLPSKPIFLRTKAQEGKKKNIKN